MPTSHDCQRIKSLSLSLIWYVSPSIESNPIKSSRISSDPVSPVLNLILSNVILILILVLILPHQSIATPETCYQMVCSSSWKGRSFDHEAFPSSCHYFCWIMMRKWGSDLQHLRSSPWLWRQAVWENQPPAVRRFAGCPEAPVGSRWRVPEKCWLYCWTDHQIQAIHMNYWLMYVNVILRTGCQGKCNWPLEDNSILRMGAGLRQNSSATALRQHQGMVRRDLRATIWCQRAHMALPRGCVLEVRPNRSALVGDKLARGCARYLWLE